MPIRTFIAVFAVVMALPLPVEADSGRVLRDMSREDLRFTFLASPHPLTAGPCEFSVFIQDSTKGHPILDAVVSFSLKKLSAPTPELAWKGPGCIASGQSKSASRGHSGNQFLYSVMMGVPEPGLWELSAVASRDGKNVSVSFPIEVASAPRILWNFWALVAIVPLAIGLYALRSVLISRRRP